MNYQIGNFIKSGTGIYMVALMSLDGIECVTKENEDVIYAASSLITEPIEITEEWINKLGFDFIEELNGWACCTHCIFEKEKGYQFNFFCSNDKDCNVHINYVHELQNLINALDFKNIK